MGSSAWGPAPGVQRLGPFRRSLQPEAYKRVFAGVQLVQLVQLNIVPRLVLLPVLLRVGRRGRA